MKSKLMFGLLVLVMLLSVTVSVSGAFAGGITNKDACEAAGGIRSNAKGTKTCEMGSEVVDGEPVKEGSSDNSPTVYAEIEVGGSESQKGNIGAKGTSSSYVAEVNGDGEFVGCHQINKNGVRSDIADFESKPQCIASYDAWLANQPQSIEFLLKARALPGLFFIPRAPAGFDRTGVLRMRTCLSTCLIFLGSGPINRTYVLYCAPHKQAVHGGK